MEKEEIKEIIQETAKAILDLRSPIGSPSVEVSEEVDKHQAISMCCRFLEQSYYMPGPICQSIQNKVHALAKTELKELI
jgi:hypothetical protein